MEEQKPTSTALRGANLESNTAEHSVIERPNLLWLCRKDLESLTLKVNLIIIHVYFPAVSLLTEGIITQWRNLVFTLQNYDWARPSPRWTEGPFSKTMTHNSAAFLPEIWNINDIPGIQEVTFCACTTLSHLVPWVGRSRPAMVDKCWICSDD